jgi:hypothetical protein
MAVVQATIKAALDVLSTNMKTAPMSDSDYNDAMAGIIRNAILSATVSGTATGAVGGGSGVPITGGLT